MYSCHIFLTSSASVKFVPFLPFIEPIFAWNVPFVSLIFLKRSVVFSILLFYSISFNWSYLSFLLFGTLHSSRYIHPFLLCWSHLFFSHLFVRPPQTAILLLHFFFLRMVLIPGSSTMSWTSIHSSSGTMSIRSGPFKSISHLHCIIVRDLIYVIPEWSSCFPCFLQFESEFGSKDMFR